MPIPKLQYKPSLLPSTELDVIKSLDANGKQLKTIIDSLPTSLRTTLGEIHLPLDNGCELIEALNTGQLLGASDGSVRTNKTKTIGGHSYSLRHWNTDKYKLTGKSPTPYSTTITSLTTELYGLLATTISLLVLTKTHQHRIVPSASATLTSDNEQAVKMAKEYEPAINISDTLKPEYDVQLLLYQI